jgi:hypothetical protein
VYFFVSQMRISGLRVGAAFKATMGRSRASAGGFAAARKSTVEPRGPAARSFLKAEAGRREALLTGNGFLEYLEALTRARDCGPSVSPTIHNPNRIGVRRFA